MREANISKSFRKLFPHCASVAEALGVNITSSPGKRVNGLPAFWLDGTYQLSGFKTKADGSPFTKDDAAEHIQKLLERIEEGRVEIASETKDQRVSRIIDGMRTLKLQFKTFCTYRHESGDEGTIFDLGGVVSAWVRLWDVPGDIAGVKDIPTAQVFGALMASYASGGKTIR